MRKIGVKIYLLVLLALISCNEKNNTAKEQQTASDSSQEVAHVANEEKVQDVNLDNHNNLVLRMEQDNKFIMQFVFHHNIELILQSKADSMYRHQTAIQDNKVVYDCTVSKVASNGDFTLNLKFKSISDKLSGSLGETKTFDSHSFKNVRDVPENYKLSYALIGKQYQVILSPLGDLKKINGIAEIKQKIIDEIKQTKQKNSQISSQIDNIFDFVRISQFYKRIFNYTTQQNITTNKKWSNEYIANMDKVLAVDAEYEILQENKNMLTLNVSAKLTDKMPNLKKNYSSQVIGEINGSGVLKGKLKVDRKTGMFSEINTKQNLKFIEKQTKKNAPNKVLIKEINRKTDFSASVKWK